MRTDNERESSNIEDRRGSEGGGGGFSLGGGRNLGLGTIVVAFVASWALGMNPMTVLSLLSGGGAPQSQSAPSSKPLANDVDARFVSVVLADTEDVWRDIFKQAGSQYREPKLVLFSGQTPTACGTGQAAMGPFYCPGDEKVYIDLRFYQELRDRYKAPGDFAQAYVIAHEVGHHVQNLLGTSGKVDAMRGRTSEAQQNQLSVRLELQADCYAGVWANHAQKMRNIIEAGDIDEAMTAAAAVGDDSIQMAARGTVVPESFTHGSAAQRTHWFHSGFQSGDLNQCNTFAQGGL
ncbi:MAG: zinc metallopeptidase [Sideroxydans sp.]|nr:zinc metallopeptidase [Sideroxydans sp.]